MASVYKSISKKKSRSSLNQQDANDFDPDVSMQDILEDPDDTSDSDEDEDEDVDDEEEEDDNEEDDQAEKSGKNGQTTSNKPANGELKASSKSLPPSHLPKTRVLMLTSRGVTHR